MITKKVFTNLNQLIKQKQLYKILPIIKIILLMNIFQLRLKNFRTIANVSDNLGHQNELILKQYLNYKFSKNNEFILPKWFKKQFKEICLYFEKFFKMRYLNYNSDFDWNCWKSDQNNFINKSYKGTLNNIFENKNKNKYIFISRLNDVRRYIDEDYILYEVLKNINSNIEYVNFNNVKMNLFENANFFSEYNVLISTHGAVLSNMIYMPENSLVIEIIAKNSGKKTSLS